MCLCLESYTYKHGGVCVYVSKVIQSNIINIDQYNKRKTWKSVP